MPNFSEETADNVWNSGERLGNPSFTFEEKFPFFLNARGFE